MFCASNGCGIAAEGLPENKLARGLGLVLFHYFYLAYLYLLIIDFRIYNTVVAWRKKNRHP
jgi:hypothetical protein